MVTNETFRKISKPIVYGLMGAILSSPFVYYSATNKAYEKRSPLDAHISSNKPNRLTIFTKGNYILSFETDAEPHVILGDTLYKFKEREMFDEKSAFNRILNISSSSIENKLHMNDK